MSQWSPVPTVGRAICGQRVARSNGRLGTPDSVRCARLSPVKRPLSGKDQRRTAIIHWTVRWCTGLFDEPTAASATVDRSIRGRRMARTNGWQGAPDCPVHQQARSCNGRMRQKRKEIAHRTAIVTVRWCTGPSDAPPDRRQVWPSKLASNGS